ncbi:esterase family protein [Alkalihalobacillus sp. LMS6]|uniref:alpha/beta hydrolase n=1 Tax=Alkalihalobacillus sp. LMS6 TaxID=2924034 RepID=UPI0020D1E1CE|nr:alpha/beta hydrolase family protein [Alkalihalobacillus sp. LMS6]UTR06237.1 esterase family protein [Alkalihalobacillus sp. LMS6]
MALIHMTSSFQSIGKDAGVQIILPDHAAAPYRTLYLLHGWSDNETAWMRHTAIEQLANEYQLAVVMPDVGLSYYTDMAFGGNYYTFVREELPRLVERHFSLSKKAEDRYVAGLSMGGFGAFKLALNDPHSYRAAASFSGALLIDELIKIHETNQEKTRQPYMQAIFGLQCDVSQTENDLLYQLQRIENNSISTAFFQYCGTEDFLYPMNQLFRKHAENSSLHFFYSDGPGDHEWHYWNACLSNWLKRLAELRFL